MGCYCSYLLPSGQWNIPNLSQQNLVPDHLGHAVQCSGYQIYPTSIGSVWSQKVLGIDTEFCSVESLITGVVDNWSETLLPHRNKFAVCVCAALYLLGLPMITEGGIYLFQVIICSINKIR